MSSGFVTESEVAEARQKRQEEWEKVRKPEEPLEAPEEAYDSRSLYTRLQEQKMKKDLEYEEAHKLKNLIRGLDDDEVQFLDLVDRAKMHSEQKQHLEDQKELDEFRQQVASLQEENLDKKIQAELSTSKPVQRTLSRPSQRSILAGAVVRKRKTSETKKSEEDEKKVPATNNSEAAVVPAKKPKSALQCIGVLPGIGPYSDSSEDSDDTSESTSDEDGGSHYNIFGQSTCKKGKTCGESGC